MSHWPAVSAMYSKMNVEARQDFVGESTENIYHDDFWGSQVLCCSFAR